MLYIYSEHFDYCMRNTDAVYETNERCILINFVVLELLKYGFKVLL